jgi:hypothetical protein
MVIDGDAAGRAFFPVLPIGGFFPGVNGLTVCLIVAFASYFCLNCVGLSDLCRFSALKASYCLRRLSSKMSR